ncbi:MAG: hypothetical protein ACXWYP_06935 [Pseudonocardia sp.]
MTGAKDDARKGTAEGGATGTVTAPAPGNRRRLLYAAIAAVLVIALVALILVLNRDNDPDAGSAASTTSAVATDTSVPAPLPTPTPTGPTEVVDQPPPALPEVPLDAEAAVGNGIVATLPQIEAIEGSAVGPGNIAGPALRVTVRIANGTAEGVPLEGVAVNMYYGTDRTPASPLDDPSRRPFGGMVAAGDSADAIYVFSVPADARDSVTIEVGYQAGAPLLLFTGPVD